MFTEEAKEAIRNSSATSSVYVGCDSIRFRKHGRWYAKYATVIIVHRDSSKGGKMFYDLQVLPDFSKDKSPKQRLLNEVMFAVNAAMEIMDTLDGRHMEIHLDINPDPKHKSNVAAKEGMGYVLGSTGLEAKIKPHAFAAMHAADWVARHRV